MVFKYIALSLLLALAAGCSTDSSIKRPPETYFSEGQTLYSKGKYEEAIAKWKKVKESFSSPILTTAAELKIADAQFDDKNYIEAAASYEDFRKLHPDNEKTPYALYKMGLSHYKQFKKIDTDQSPLKDAASAFETFLREYPDSELADKVRKNLQLCRAKQSEYEIYVGRFYYRTDKYASAIGRLKSELEKYPNSPDNDKALYYLGRAYMETGDMEKARETFEQLVKNHKTGEFAEKAGKLLTETTKLASTRKKS
jgi:outer membrane protein assembly factor BamD